MVNAHAVDDSEFSCRPAAAAPKRGKQRSPEKLFHVSAAAPAPFRLLWSCKSRLVHKISFVWSLIYFEFMALSVDF